jgi:hypothetical protein
MATRDYQSINIYPAFKTFTVGDAACDEILLPSACNQVSVGCESTKIYIAQNGYTEGDDIDTTDNAFVPASNFLIMKLGKGKNRTSSIFIQSSSGNVKVHVILEEI